MRSFNLSVKGMTCASCVARVEKAVSNTPGVKNASVNFASEKVYFETENDNFDVLQIKKAVDDYGYELIVPDENEIKAILPKDSGKLRKELLLSTVLTVPVFIISMLFHFGILNNIYILSNNTVNYILLVLTTPVILISGRRFFIIFYKNLKHLSFEMNSLVAIGTGSAYLFSVFNTLFPQILLKRGIIPDVYFETAAVIITLILSGKMLEEKAKNRTNDAIKKLIELKPLFVNVIINGNEEKVKIESLKPGQTVIIRPGDRIPADGLISSGLSTIDESLLTGESIPVAKQPGDKITGGTINKNGSFYFEVTETGDNSVLGQIIKLVESAQSSKAPIQKLADKISGIFVPIVMAVSALSFAGWLLISGTNDLGLAILSSVAVLIIACPCALGLATPTAIIAGTGRGAMQGILIKNAESLEKAHKIQTLFLDKTGTITEGKPRVTDVFSVIEETEHLRFCASLERKSEHPIADSIVEFVASKGLLMETPDFFERIPGLGIKGKIGDKEIFCGNEILMRQNNISLEDLIPEVEKLSAWGKTVIFTSINNKLAGIIAVEDPIKENSVKAVQKLIDSDVEVFMLTGDNNLSAASIAKRIGIKNFLGDVLPENKLEQIRAFQQKGIITGMAGDGVNDAPALAQADVSFAMGTGSDSAKETADITLVQGDLMNVYRAINLSKKTYRIIKQNLFWAFFYNSLGIPLAALGMLNPMIAALAMSFSSVFVVSNSLRLKRIRI